MRRVILIATAAAGLFALAAAPAGAKTTKTMAAAGSPPHASVTGRTHRSAVAATSGANKRGFCPPGQAKKRGKGSAFNC